MLLPDPVLMCTHNWFEEEKKLFFKLNKSWAKKEFEKYERIFAHKIAANFGSSEKFRALLHFPKTATSDIFQPQEYVQTHDLHFII